jgi:hypothetical protein
MNCSNHNGELPRNHTRPLFAVSVSVALLLFPIFAYGGGAVSPQVFTRGALVYVVDQKQITYFSMDTRSAHTLYSSPDSLFDITGIARSGDVIWTSNGMGAVIAVNMQTGTVEDFSRGLVGGGGAIDVDRRFVWVAAGDTLYRMDLTSREWVRIAIPGTGVSEVRGLLSFNNEQIHVVASDAVRVLTVASGDWVTVPHRDFTLAAGDVRRVGDAVYFTQERAVYRYDPSKRLFAGAAVKELIRAASLGPDYIDVVAGNRVYTFNTRSFSLEPTPLIPMLRGIRSITRSGDRFVCAADMGLVTYTSPFDLSAAPYPNHINVDNSAFVFTYMYAGHVYSVLYSRGGFIVYDPDRNLWSGIRIRHRAGSNAVRKGLYGWDEDGAHVTFSDKYVGTPGGTATFRVQPYAEYSDTAGFKIDPIVPLANVTLNLRTEDTDGRILDLVVDNAATTLPPQKGFYYKGVEDDILSRASFGVQGTGLEQSNISPPVTAEGGYAVFSGAKTATGRDRNFVTGTAGSGYILSRSKWISLGYNSDGLYDLNAMYSESRDIVPNTVKIYVDGIPLPATDFIYNPVTRTVRLLRREKTNRTSVIQASFAERAYPADRVTFEPLPEDHFGQYNFAEGVVSPREWMSARAGFLTIDRGDSGFSPIVLAGIPAEWRGAGGRSLLFYPEVAYDNRLGAHSAGVTAGVTEGRAFGAYSGRWVGRDFVGLDRPTFYYQSLNDEHEINFGYDLRDNLRAGIYQMHRRTENNSLSNFELRTSYTGNTLPDIEMTVGGLFNEDNPNTETSKRGHKESFSLRLSDLSVRNLSGRKGIHNTGYDFSWTEYRDNTMGHGRMAYGMANFSPIQALTVTGTATYRLNPMNVNEHIEMNPKISVNTRDFPRGFDIGASYALNVTEYVDGVSDVVTDGSISGYFYPGEYADALRRFVLYGYCVQVMEHRLPLGAQPITYGLFSDELMTSKRTFHEAGLLFFPTDNLLLSTLNSRYRDTRTGVVNYATIERAGLWLQNGSKFEAEALVGVDNPAERLRLYGKGQYEHKWASGLMTGIGAFGSRSTEKDSANAAIDAGPLLSASITKELGGYISIENSHYLSVSAMRSAGAPAPEVVYVFYFRLKMLPDISIVAELATRLQGQKSRNMSAGAYLHAGF